MPVLELGFNSYQAYYRRASSIRRLIIYGRFLNILMAHLLYMLLTSVGYINSEIALLGVVRQTNELFCITHYVYSDEITTMNSCYFNLLWIRVMFQSLCNKSRFTSSQ